VSEDKEYWQMVTYDPRHSTRSRLRPVVVMPTYNERDNIRLLVPAIMSYAGFHVLVIDDGSPDGTAAEVLRLGEVYPGRVHLLARDGKRGLGTAYIAGFRWALERDYTHIFEMDADFSHHPAALPRLLSASRESDLVIGSRYVRGGRTVNWPWYRKLISRGGAAYGRMILGLDIRDLTGGFKCFRRLVLEALDLDAISSTGYAFQIELTYRAARLGFRINEIPITFSERRAGVSKMNSAIVGEAIVRVLQLRSEAIGVRRATSARAPLALEWLGERSKRPAK
jgi:dolichol-phosphate mannosyltransferase